MDKRPPSFDEVASLEQQIADLQKQWPAHSLSPAMLIQLEELEEALEDARKRLAGPSEAGDREHP